MSSLVLTADRSKIPRRDNEPTGEPETLVGRIDPKSMGSRAFKESVNLKQDISKKKTKHALNHDERPRRVAEASSRRYGDVIEAIQEIEGLSYKPRTTETKQIYELLLSTVHLTLGDQPNDIIRSAADMTIETLKNDNEYPKDLDKKRAIEEFTGTITNEKFNELSNLCKKLTDYGGDDADQQGPGDGAEEGEGKTRATELEDDNNGVAVVFEDDEGDEDSDEDEFEIRDEEDSEEENADEETREEEENDGDLNPTDNTTEQIIIGPDSKTGQSREKKSKQELTIHDIDGFWLQRLIGSHFLDPIEAESKTKEAINLLSAENSTLRDLENSLVDLFDYDKFDLVSILTKNRDIIVWGTKWSRSDEDEKVNLAVVMREKGAGWIVKALTTGRGINNPQLQATTDNTKMDIDGDGATTSAFPTKANLVPNSFLPNPKKVLDLSSMKFNQGSRTMTNKKCKLPEGSHKVQPTGKGYEEIHVPAPQKAVVSSEDLVKISELPFWCREAFKGATSLNRVQSKTFPVAFGQDDPILLCAPTGAGKVCVLLHQVSSLHLT